MFCNLFCGSSGKESGKAQKLFIWMPIRAIKTAEAGLSDKTV